MYKKHKTINHVNNMWFFYEVLKDLQTKDLSMRFLKICKQRAFL